MENEDFNPDDLDELESTFARILKHNDSGYIMEFSISRLNAQELLECWHEAMMGDQIAMARSMMEYAKIMTQLQIAELQSDLD